MRSLPVPQNCSQQCQRTAWKEDKKTCNVIAKAEAQMECEERQLRACGDLGVSFGGPPVRPNLDISGDSCFDGSIAQSAVCGQYNICSFEVFSAGIPYLPFSSVMSSRFERCKVGLFAG